MKLKLILALILVANIRVTNAQFTVLHSFTGGSPISQYDDGSLISDGTYLYGATQFDGTYDRGYIYKIKPDGTMFDSVYHFLGALNGSRPRGTLFNDGTYFYGLGGGGTGFDGTLFKVKSDGTGYSIVYDFGGAPDGGLPQGSLYYDGTFLYGTTISGGTFTAGTLFKIKPDGSAYQKLHDFSGPDGQSPFGTLVSDGTYLYGTALAGAFNNGVIFKIKTDGTGFSDLFDFSYLTSGHFPCGSLLLDGTDLYGMAARGGVDSVGTLYKIETDGTNFVKLLEFNGANGAQPETNLLHDSTFLYGMTVKGGSSDDGVIFKVRKDGTDYSLLHNFNLADGQYPYGSLYSDGASLYGRTRYGGGTDSSGTLFKISKDCIANYSTSYDSIANNFTLTVDSSTTAAAIAYHWDFGDGSTSMLATPSHVYALDSLYNVCMKVFFAAGDSCTYCHVIGIDSTGGVFRATGFTLNVITTFIITNHSDPYFQNTLMSVFPNPAQNSINIKLDVAFEGNFEIKIINAVGQVVNRNCWSMQKGVNVKELNIDDLSQGVYLIQLESPENFIRGKFLKK